MNSSIFGSRYLVAPISEKLSSAISMNSIRRDQYHGLSLHSSSSEKATRLQWFDDHHSIADSCLPHPIAKSFKDEQRMDFSNPRSLSGARKNEAFADF